MQFFKRVLMPTCSKCGLNGRCSTHQMPLYGQGHRGILLIGTSPSPEEDAAGMRGVGPEYELLQEMFQGTGIDLEQDCWRIDAVNCVSYNRNGDRRPPTDNEVDACRPMLQKVVRDLKPTTVILMGNAALKSFYGAPGSGYQYLSVERYMNQRIPDSKNGAWVTAIYAPEYMVDNDFNQNLRMVYDFSFSAVFDCIESPPPQVIDYDSRVQILTEFKDVCGVLEEVLAKVPERFTHDYEANCVKPHWPLAKLYSMSFKTPLDAHAFSFPVHWPGHWSNEQETIIDGHIRRILQHRRIGKVAHNMSMEDGWGAKHLGALVAPWKSDTMISQHIICTERNTKGLKDQAWFRYGVHGYDDAVEVYLKSKGTYNNIHKAPKPLILHYGGLDSLFTDMLYCDQRAYIEEQAKDDPKYLAVDDLFKRGGVVLNRISQRGFRIDTAFYEEQTVKLQEEIAKLSERLLGGREAKLFKRDTGRVMRLDSSDDLRYLLVNVMKYKIDKRTGADKEAVDKEILTEIGSRFAKNMLAYRKAGKILSTYVSPFTKLAVDERIHPSFNLHVARSGRSSSSEPNFQNLPKRDPLAKQYVRKGIIPDEGFHFCEADYSSLEVRIFACHCLDPVLIDYVNDPTTDMHRDQCVDLFMLDGPDYVSKSMRGDMKAGWVFAEFYGSYYKSCARKMWDGMILPEKICLNDPLTGGKGVTLKQHLDNKGIRCHADFEAYLEDYEKNKFWARFAVTKEYQMNAFKEYQRKGYIETKWGFRRGGFLSKNKIINTPTQGTGFQNLLWSLVEMDRIRQKEKWLSFFVGQIHDSINSNIHPSELQYVLDMHHYIMCERIRELNDWIIVPLEIEVAIAPVNAPWYDTKDFIRIQTGEWVQKDLYKQDEHGDWFPKEVAA